MKRETKFKLTSKEERLMDVVSNAIIDLILSDSKKYSLIKHRKGINLIKEYSIHSDTKNGKTPRN